MGTGCASLTQKPGWCTRQISNSSSVSGRTFSCPTDRRGLQCCKSTSPCPTKPLYSKRSVKTRVSSVGSHSFSSAHKLHKGASEGFGFRHKGLSLGSLHPAMRGLALLRALNAAVAFEGHVMGRGTYASWIVPRGRAATAQAGGEDNPGVTRSSEAACSGHPNDALSPSLSDVFKTDNISASVQQSSASSIQKPLPPLLIVEQLLTIRGGPKSLPLFKNGRSVGTYTPLKEDTSGPLDPNAAEHRHMMQSLPKLPHPDELLELSPAMLEFFRQRGVSEQTLSRNGVRRQLVYSPKEKEEVAAIVFPYVRDGRLVNAKYRTLDKQYWQIKGAEQSLYGIDDVSGSETVIIVEGEMDKLALEEAGYTNCVSVPGGAPNNVRDQALPPPNPVNDRPFAYLWTCQEQLSKASKFVLATDADRPGLVLSEELVRRLGRERCWQVTWPVLPDGQRVKDANEALLKFGKRRVRLAIEGARAFPSMEAVETELELSAECSGQTEDGSLGSAVGTVEVSVMPEGRLIGGTPGGFLRHGEDGLGAGVGSHEGDRGSRDAWKNWPRQTGLGNGQMQSTSVEASATRSLDGVGVGVGFEARERELQDGLVTENDAGISGGESGLGVNSLRRSEAGVAANGLSGSGSNFGVNALPGKESGSGMNGLPGMTKLRQGVPWSVTAHGVALRGGLGAFTSERGPQLSGGCERVSMQSRGMCTSSHKAVSGSQSGTTSGTPGRKAVGGPVTTTPQRVAAFLKREKPAWHEGGSRLRDPWVGGRTPDGEFATEETEFGDALEMRSNSGRGKVSCRSWRAARGEVDAGGSGRGGTGYSKGPAVRKVGLRRSKDPPKRDAGTGNEARLLTDILPRQEPERAQPPTLLGGSQTVSTWGGKVQVRDRDGKMGSVSSSSGMHAAAGPRQAATEAADLTDLIRKTAELSVRDKRAPLRTSSNHCDDHAALGSRSSRTSETGLVSAAPNPHQRTAFKTSAEDSGSRVVTAFGRSEMTVAENEASSAEDLVIRGSPAAAGLNNEQLAAVFAPVGPVRVVAGPGSGKTKVLTNRVAHLVLDQVVRPWNILCITFTNKAASEMRERVGKMLDNEKADSPAVGTFHGICARILRKSVSSIPDCGRTTTYVIYDENDSMTLLRQIVKTIPGTDSKNVNFRELLSKLVNEKLWRSKLEINTQSGDPLVGAVVPFAAAEAESDGEPPIQMDPIVQLIAAQYEVELRKCNAFDFSDLLIWSVRLLRSCPTVLQDYRKLWRHLLVDEFQDTDFAQYELVRLLGKEHQSVFVVGDLDQSIYGWRGADFRNMQTLFERDFPGGKVYQLRKNYRSTRTILQAAEALITRSEVSRTIGRHKPLQLDPIKPFGRNITFLEAETDRQEAAQVVTHVRHMVEAQGHSWGDMAVLYRTNMQSRLFQEELTKRGIPFLVLGGLSFYARKEIKDIISYLKLIANPLDEVALNRVFNLPPRGIGPKAMEKLRHWAASLQMTLPKALYEHRKELPEELVLVGKAKTGIQKFVLLLDHLSAMSHTESLDVLIREILQRTEYKKYIEETKSESNEEKEERWQHIQDLRHVAREHAKKNGEGATALAAFLEDVALVAAVDEEGIEGGAAYGKSAQAAKPVVKLMTIHASKGLEFPCVFLVGLEEGLLPTSYATSAKALVAEERRLCYVAITRAKDRLFLSRAEIRYLYGEALFQKPSRFWREMS